MSESGGERNIENNSSQSNHYERIYYCYKCDREFSMNETVYNFKKLIISRHLYVYFVMKDLLQK